MGSLSRPQDPEYHRPRMSGETHASEELPAWSARAAEMATLPAASDSPAPLTREGAWGGSTGAGVRVCIVDSGIEPDHPLVGEVERSVAVSAEPGGEPTIADDDLGDPCGHGTACAGIIRSLAPRCTLASVRVLGAGMTGSGRVLLAGLRWAVEEGYEVINLSLSTKKREVADLLRELTDSAYFRRRLIVASAHNLVVDSYPWRFSSVISVGSHDRPDPFEFFYNSEPPVEFFARGLDLEVAWRGGGTIRSTGNSFATPHIAGICALVLGKHPELTPFQVKSVLYQTADNARES